LLAAPGAGGHLRHPCAYVLEGDTAVERAVEVGRRAAAEAVHEHGASVGRDGYVGLAATAGQDGRRKGRHRRRRVRCRARHEDEKDRAQDPCPESHVLTVTRRDYAGEVNLQGEDLRRAIDDAIAEIDRVEEEMLELFAELLGPEAAIEVAKYTKAQEEGSSLRALMRKRLDELGVERERQP